MFISGSIYPGAPYFSGHSFFINCTDIDGLTVFSLKFLIRHYTVKVLLYNKSAPYYYINSHDRGYYTLIGYNDIALSCVSNFDFNLSLLFYNDLISVNYTDIVSQYSGVYDSDFFVNGNCLKKIMFICDDTRMGYTDSGSVKIDSVGIIVNGETISTEVYPEDVFILSYLGITSLEFATLEVFFNYDGYNNNVSIYINDDIHIINYGDWFVDGCFRHSYTSQDFNGVYLRIYNSSSYNIVNIKLYVSTLVNSITSEEYSLEFSSSGVEDNESYFYVDSSNSCLLYTSPSPRD